jgi:predicted dinucleotide-binding enzyme
MKIGIIGTGNIGATLARLLVRAGHDVALSNSRGPDSLSDLVQELGSRARAVSVKEAARWGDAIVLAVPWRSPEALPRPELVAGKVVIDAMNPYRSDGGIFDLGDSTSSEEVAKRLPGARVVKAFNTMYYQHLLSRGRPEAPLDMRHAIFLASDDTEAKARVSQLIEDIGFAPVDTGSLREGGRSQQPGSAVYNKPMTSGEARKLLSGR